jgi:hypothetical protein
VVLRTPTPTELLVSWLRDDGADGEYVTLQDVIAAHAPEDEAPLVDEHVGCLSEVAAILSNGSGQWLQRVVPFDEYADVGFAATIEGVIDFAAEVSTWSLARIDQGKAGPSDWGPAIAVMRSLTALSATVTVLDAAREALHPSA